MDCGFVQIRANLPDNLRRRRQAGAQSRRMVISQGDVLLTASMTGLPKDSVANVSQILALDRALLDERVGRIAPAKTDLLLAGLDIVLGR